MKCLFVALCLCGFVFGCAAPSKAPSAAGDEAVRCAKGWNVRGFDFNPNTMTCSDMYERAQAIRSAAYWQTRGYVFDAASMTAKEMDAKARDLQRSGVRQYPPPSDKTAQTAQTDGAPAAPPTRADRPATQKPPGKQTERERIRTMLEGMTITQVRVAFPQYDDLNDVTLARTIHAEYFSEVPVDEFARQFIR